MSICMQPSSALPPPRACPHTAYPQVMMIAAAPTVIALELLMFRRVPPVRIIASVMVVCAGIGVATLTDAQVKPSPSFPD